ncbi:hypothetical protein J6590_096358, partial [Homalodisca vitripennis]
TNKKGARTRWESISSKDATRRSAIKDKGQGARRGLATTYRPAYSSTCNFPFTTLVLIYRIR